MPQRVLPAAGGGGGALVIATISITSLLLAASAALAALDVIRSPYAAAALGAGAFALLAAVFAIARQRRDRRGTLTHLESALFRAGEEFADADNETAVAQVLADAACDALGTRLTWVARWEAGALRAVPVAAAATRSELLAQLPAAFVIAADAATDDEPLTSTLTQGRARLVSEDLVTTLDTDWAQLAKRADCRAVLFLPLRTGRDMWGAAAFCYAHPPAPSDRRLLQTLARRAGHTLTSLNQRVGGKTPAAVEREQQRAALTEAVAAEAIGASSVPALLRAVLAVIARSEGLRLTHRDGFVLLSGAGTNTRFIASERPRPAGDYLRQRTAVACGDANYGELSASLDPTLTEAERSAMEAWLSRIAMITALGMARLRGDEGLAASEARYRTIFEALGIGYFEVSRSGRFTYANDSVAAIFGCTPHGLLGTHSREYMAASTHHWLSGIYNAAWRGGGTAVANGYAVTGCDGTSRLVSSSALVRHGPLGEQIGFRGILVDETERHLTERRLRENESLFRALAESSPVAIFMHRDFRWIFANRAAEELTGYPRDRLVGRHILDVVTPEARGLTRRQASARVRGERLGESYVSEIEHADGTRRIVEIYGNQITSEDQPAAIISVIDITRQREVLERAQRLTGLLDAAETLAAVGSFEWEPDADSLLVSPTFAGLTGRPPQVMRLPIADFLHCFVETDREAVVAFMGSATDVTEPREMPVRLADDEDRDRGYLLRAAPHLASSQESLTVVGILRPLDTTGAHACEETG